MGSVALQDVVSEHVGLMVGLDYLHGLPSHNGSVILWLSQLRLTDVTGIWDWRSTAALPAFIARFDLVMFRSEKLAKEVVVPWFCLALSLWFALLLDILRLLEGSSNLGWCPGPPGAEWMVLGSLLNLKAVPWRF